MQMDIYAQVLKSMEEKMNKIENKTKSFSSNVNTGRNTAVGLDESQDEILKKLENIRYKFEKVQ